MAKKSSVTIAHHIQRGGGEWLEVEYTGGPFAGKKEKILKARAESLVKQKKAVIIKKQKDDTKKRSIHNASGS